MKEANTQTTRPAHPSINDVNLQWPRGAQYQASSAVATEWLHYSRVLQQYTACESDVHKRQRSNTKHCNGKVNPNTVRLMAQFSPALTHSACSGMWVVT